MLAAALHYDLKNQFTGLSFVLCMSLRCPLYAEWLPTERTVGVYFSA